MGAAAVASDGAAEQGDARPMANTGIHVPADLLERLRMVAVRRATLRGGGRPSVSEVLVDLAERHIDRLEEEVGLRGPTTP
jgi:hypothetical protein